MTCVRVSDTFGATASPGRSLRPANRLVPRGRGQHGRTGAAQESGVKRARARGVAEQWRPGARVLRMIEHSTVARCMTGETMLCNSASPVTVAFSSWP